MWCIAPTNGINSLWHRPDHKSWKGSFPMGIVKIISVLSAVAILLACSIVVPASPTPMDLKREVADTKRAFAKSMADRDHAAFASFLSVEAVFFSGPEPLCGKVQVANAWKRFYSGSTAPFSWQPEQVEVLPSGTLAISSGPVHDAQGKLIATFTSIWRIVFDKGDDACNCRTP